MSAHSVLRAYRKVHRKTAGWFSWESAMVWDSLLRFQAREPIGGDMLEIGVHHGKSAAMLLLHADRESESCVLVDKFPNPSAVRKALRKLPRTVDRDPPILEMDSRRMLESEAITARSGRYRWIHIDGEHSVAALRSDLDAAHELIGERGVVCVDDIFNHLYPHLTLELFRYLDAHPDRFTVFLVGYPKAYLARPAVVRSYLDHCFHHLVAEAEEAQVELTLAKTAPPDVFPGFSIHSRVHWGGTRVRGPDEAQDRVDY